MGIPLIYYLIACALLAVLLYKRRRVSLSLAIAYMVLIFASTVLARMENEGLGNDWTPLRLLRVDRWWIQEDMILQIVANILMFIPIGLLLTPTVG